MQLRCCMSEVSHHSESRGSHTTAFCSCRDADREMEKCCMRAHVCILKLREEKLLGHNGSGRKKTRSSSEEDTTFSQKHLRSYVLTHHTSHTCRGCVYKVNSTHGPLTLTHGVWILMTNRTEPQRRETTQRVLKMRCLQKCVWVHVCRVFSSGS